MRWIPAQLTVMLCAGGLFAASNAYAERTNFRSAHPIPAELPGSFCHIDVTHTHTYTPDESDSYVEHDAAGDWQLEFVGDPTPLGFEGPVSTYGEAHPMHFEGGSSEIQQYCQLEGTHYHLHDPLDPTQFEDREGTYYFESYKAAKVARRNYRKLIKVEAKVLKKAERNRQKAERKGLRASKREERPDRKSTRTVRRRGSGSANVSVAATAVSTPTTPRTPTATKGKPKSTKSKSPRRGFRSWMDRRRGR